MSIFNQGGLFFSLTAPDQVLQRKKRYNHQVLLSTGQNRGFMRTILNILNFILGGFATTLGWLLATLVSIILIVTLPLTRSCWKSLAFRYFPTVTRRFMLTSSSRGAKTVY